MWIFYLWFPISCLLVLGYVIPIYKKHYKVTGKPANYDSSGTSFVYKVSMSGEEIIRRLQIRNIKDELTCTFDFERSVITFSEYDSSRAYFFEIQEHEGFSILKLRQVSIICMQSYVPMRLNPFITEKLDAEIVPYSQYGA